MTARSFQDLLTTNFGLAPSGYTGSQGITGYNGSQGPLGPQGTVGYTGSASTSVNEIVKTYFYQGVVDTNTGTIKLYVHADGTLTSVKAFVSVTANTSTAIAIKRNSQILETLTIASGQSSASITGLTHALLENDAITVDVTQGSLAEDLYVQIVYQV